MSPSFFAKTESPVRALFIWSRDVAKGKYEKWKTKEGLVLLRGWARDGLTDEQIAKNMGITASTLYAWKNTHSEISEALKNGKEITDYFVENALLKAAMEGNTTAQIFWLKNRRSDKWRERPAEAAVTKDNKIDAFEKALDDIAPDAFSEGTDV